MKRPRYAQKRASSPHTVSLKKIDMNTVHAILKGSFLRIQMAYSNLINPVRTCMACQVHYVSPVYQVCPTDGSNLWFIAAAAQ